MTKNKLKIRKLSVTLTRQVTQFNPIVFGIESELDDNDDPNEVAKALKRAVISVVYSDMPDERNKMISRLVGAETPITNLPKANVVPNPSAKDSFGDPVF